MEFRIGQIVTISGDTQMNYRIVNLLENEAILARVNEELNPQPLYSAPLDSLTLIN